MKIGQFKLNGEKKIIIIDNGNVYQNIENFSPHTIDLINELRDEYLSEKILNLIKNKKFVKISDDEQFIEKNNYQFNKPLDPPEAWAVGVTYKRQALEHDKNINESGKKENLYYYVYANDRAEVFFKGNNRTIFGNEQTLMLRCDSNLVMPEAELVLILGKKGLPIAYTLGNDLTAWDIEKDSPLYLSQAKIWSGSGSIGPWIIPSEKVNNPYDIEIGCTVKRENKIVLNSKGNTSGLKRSIEELCYYLNLSNEIPTGTVLFTGTACVIDHEFGLKKNDEVIIYNNLIGELKNKIDRYKKVEKNFIKRDK